MKCFQRVLIFTLLLTAGRSFAADTYAYHESFEDGLGRWTAGSPADISWSWKSGPTTSTGTGPSGAHDENWYIYTEASGGGTGYPLKTALLEAQFDISSLSSPAMAFYYHMYGSDMGTLSVEVDNGLGWTPLWSRVGQQHVSEATPWSRADIDLSAYVGATSLKIRFNGLTGSDFRSDMCVDDIWIYNSSLIPDDFIWGPISNRQTSGISFPVEITAVNSMGQTLTTFNQAVDITGWSAGFPEPVSNGDFESGSLFPWVNMNVGPTPGPYLLASVLYGSGQGFEMQPDTGVDGISQDLFLREGETYNISAYYSVLNSSTSTDFSGTIEGRIRIDGVDIDTSTLFGLSRYRVQYHYMSGTFVPPADGTYTLQLISYTSSGQVSYLHTYFDNVSVNFSAAQYIDPAPAMSGQFVNGVWTGSVTVDEIVPETRLYARYVDVRGESPVFSTYVSPLDQDGDGLRDSWEELYFPNIAACIPSVDDDDDGYINSDEYVIGSNPKVKSSNLEFVSTINENDECFINWFCTSNRTYELQYTDNLFFPFTDLATGIRYPQGSYTNDISGSSKGYYRIKVRY